MAEAWEGWYTVGIMFCCFVALMKNVAGPDVLMLGSLAMMLAANIMDIPDGLKGFSNKGLLTVACLFVVAAGISNTGALDYYMSKLLGTPKTVASAQVRLMVPVAFVSAFLNNTPVVAIMIPILQKWSKKCGISPSQLFIPLSFASILGGTCTLIGTSTNLVVEGMMRERYPDAEPIGMFDLSMYGVPVALSGFAYILIFSPFLLPGGKRTGGANDGGGAGGVEDSLAVGAVVAPGSSVVGKPVATLRGLNGLYLVSVQRGDMLLRAVTPEFLLEEGDVLHFTGLIESIGEVCSEHGLLPLTHEVEEHIAAGKLGPVAEDEDGSFGKVNASSSGGKAYIVSTDPALVSLPPHPGERGKARSTDTFPPPRASTRGGAKPRKGSEYKTVLHAFSMDDDATNEGSRRGGSAYHSNASDNEGGYTSAERGGYTSGGYSGYSSGGGDASTQSADEIDRHQPAVRRRRRSFNASNMLASARRRISLDGGKKGKGRKKGGDDEFLLTATGDVQRASNSPMPIHEVLAAKDTPVAVRKALLDRHQILRCRVRNNSSLIGRTPVDVGFRERYKAALIAVKRGGEDLREKQPSSKLADVKFEPGDILMLHCLDKCPLLQFREPAIGGGGSGTPAKGGSQASSLGLRPGGSTPSLPAAGNSDLNSRRSSLSREESGREGSGDEKVVIELEGDDDETAGKDGSDDSAGKGNSGLGHSRGDKPPLAAPVASRPAASGQSSAAQLLGKFSNEDRRDSASSVEGQGTGHGNDRANSPGYRPMTPGAERQPDPDLEVLSREGSEDIRAMTDFTCPMRVIPGGAADGKTLVLAGLRGLPGLFLTAIHQAGAESEAMTAPGPDYVLSGGDVLWFAGDAAGIQSLRRIPGILAENKQVDKLKLHKTDRRLIQAVVAVQSPLIGNTVRDARFRTQFDAVIIAVQRSGGRIQAKIGDIVLQAGDVLLLDTGSSFLKLYKSDPAFALVSEIENSAPPQFEKLLPACGTAVVMIITFVVGALDLFVAALLASGVMLATGCLTQNAARKSVKWEVITTIAAAFGISAAMEQSGVAGEIAKTLVEGASGTGSGTPGVLIAVYIATFFLCNVVGNNAAAALMYPIAAGAAEGQGVDRDQMSFLLMLAASASFMSPFGYQTNLMVYGPGGYVFNDFLRFGLPMQIWQMVVSVGVVLLKDLWWVGWIAAFGAVGIILVVRQISANIGRVRECIEAPESPKQGKGLAGMV